MIGFVLQRILSMLPTALLVLVLVGGLVHLVPGDPVDALLGEQAAPNDRAALRAALGLDLPVWQQLTLYSRNLMAGDLGQSMVSGRSVAEMLWERAPATAALALVAMGVALLLGGAGGVLGALLRGRGRRVWDALTLALLITPSFVLGPLLIWGGAVVLGLFPVAGFGGPQSLVLPALTLGCALGMVLARFLAESLERTLGLPLMVTVRAKGASRTRALGVHALPLALGPVVQIVFLQLGMVLTGAVLTEAVFGWPGVGSLLVDALHQRDLPMIQASILCISVTYMMCVLLSDGVMAWLDPRLRPRAA